MYFFISADDSNEIDYHRCLALLPYKLKCYVQKGHIVELFHIGISNSILKGLT